jgi:lysozyme family protein
VVNLDRLKAENATRWANAKVTRNFTYVAEALVADKAKVEYLLAEKYTGVPWWVIAVIHEREAAQRWDANIANGELWNRETKLVPKGRGPFENWITAAIDALCFCPPYAAKNKDWSIGGTLTLLETYNGIGYYEKGIPSPYIWSGTDQYIKGKYIRDGIFSPETIDVQLGCAGLIVAMMKLDRTIVFGTPVPHFTIPTVQKPPVVVPLPIPQPPRQRDSWVQAFIDLFKALFGRK